MALIHVRTDDLSSDKPGRACNINAHALSIAGQLYEMISLKSMRMKRQTKQRSVVQQIFEQAQRPLSPSEVFDQARSELRAISLATIYRTLKALIDDGTLVPVSLPGLPDRYETRGCAEHHHHHFHCDGCGRVFDVPGCGLHTDVRNPSGFSVKRHAVVLYGDCRECSVNT